MVVELAAAKIAEIAFGKLVETAVGKGIEASVEKLKPLRDKIWHKLRGNAEAQAALAEVQQNPSPANLERVAKFLDAAMIEDTPFADEIRTLAQQINQEIDARNIQDNSRTQINRDNAKGYQVETVKAENVQFGDVHHH